MNENEKKNGWLSILGYVALIVVLFIGIKVVFAGLGRVIPKTEDIQPQFTALNNREGQQVSYGLRLLTDEEAQSEEVRQWLGKAQEQAGNNSAAVLDRHWLFGCFVIEKFRSYCGSDADQQDQKSMDAVAVNAEHGSRKQSQHHIGHHSAGGQAMTDVRTGRHIQ